MKNNGYIDFNKKIIEELNNGNYKKYSEFPIFLKVDGWKLTYEFIDLTKNRPILQKMKSLSLNSHFQSSRYSIKRALEKVDYKSKLGLKIDLDTEELIRIYQVIATSKISKDETKLERLEQKLSKNTDMLIKIFELREGFRTSIMVYLLTGKWIVPTGISVEVDERGEINLKISENTSLADIKKHWKFIDEMKGLLIPEPDGQKRYNYLDRDSDIYYSSKWTHETVKEIGERYNLDETTTRKIVSRVKKRARDI